MTGATDDAPPRATPPAGQGPATEREARLAAELALARRKLEGIEAISRLIGSELSLDRILDTVIARTTELLEAERATLFVLDAGGTVLWSRQTHGGDVETIEVPLGQGLAGWVARNGRTVNVKDAYKDARFDPTYDRSTGFRTRSVLCAPLRDSQQKVIGVLQVLNKRDGYFTLADEDLLSAIASQAGISIQNGQLYVDIIGKNIDLFDTSIRLEARTKELELLFKVERSAATATTVDAAFTGILADILSEFPCGIGALLLDDANRHTRRTVASGGFEADRYAEEAEPLVVALAAHVLASGHALRYAAHDDGVSELVRALLATAGWDLQHALAVPITHKGTHLGAVVLLDRVGTPGGFTEADERILGAIGGRLGLAVALARALDEERKAERLAAIGQMLSGVLHDLKTPLTIIGGYARMMAVEEDAAARQEQREAIRRQIAQLKDMTRELLAFARGESEVLFRRVFVREFLDDAAELLREELGGAGVALEVDDAFRGALRMDETKMRRVVYNLARNAREAMPDGGTFRIRVEQSGDEVVFTFADDGPGIPAEMQGRLFDPFATFGKRNGTGLGLAIVKKIVDEHRGRIDVASRPGEGTTFTLALPATL